MTSKMTAGIPKIQIITHRGLNPSLPNFFAESTHEAFKDHLGKGYGIEFDLNFTRDQEIFIFHDSDLSRITNGKNHSKTVELSLKEILSFRFSQGERLCSLDCLLKLIENSKSKINAVHLKGKFQDDKKKLDILISSLKSSRHILDRLLVFDVTVKTARYLKKSLPELNLAPSVSHQYDIQRYGHCINDTLLPAEEVIANKKLFGWVWLDEWDLAGLNDTTKKLYTREIFNQFRKEGLKIALVTPELHGTSPGLLGGEAHPDAENEERLFGRIKEILDLEPGAVCTDYPEETKNMQLCI
jgi:glycerophosphoryl diester phosphodiesterase